MGSFLPKAITMLKKVFVNGYGSIGSRITSFLKDDPEIAIIGVGKYSPDEKVNSCNIKRIKQSTFQNEKLMILKITRLPAPSSLHLMTCDLVVDAAPGGHGYKNKKNLYEPKNIPAIYQGGESTMGDSSSI